VEIFTSKSENARPTQDWLGFVKSPRARTKIRQYFKKERRDEAIEQGKEALNRAMRREGLPLKRMLTIEPLVMIGREFNLPDVASLYAAIGESQVSAQTVVTRLVTSYGGEEGSIEDLAEQTMPTRPARMRQSTQDPGVVVVGVSDVWIKLAGCCTPVPGDDVFGFVTRSGGVSVHREDCANADDLRGQPGRVAAAEWRDDAKGRYALGLLVEANWRPNLLTTILAALRDIRVISAKTSTSRGGIAAVRLQLLIADSTSATWIVEDLRHVPGVFEVSRRDAT
jgi:GTP pyrophosphokinase